MTADHLDACRDAGALIRATAARDREAVNVILDHGDTRAVAEILATVVVTACRTYSGTFLDDLCTGLRHTDHQDD